MPAKTLTVGAIIGSALMALLLTGSSPNTAISPIHLVTFEDSQVRLLASEAMALFERGQYAEARTAFSGTAMQAHGAGIARAEAMNWNNAGDCALLEMQFSAAIIDFAKAKSAAEAGRQYAALATILNSLASLYLQMGQPENAVRVAREALDGPAGSADPLLRPMLLSQLAQAYMELGRFDEALPLFRAAIAGFVTQGNPDTAATAWGNIGAEFLRVNRLTDAEAALNEERRLVQTNHLKDTANILSGMAKLKSRQGDYTAAESLFAAALTAPPNVPRYALYAERGLSRLNSDDLPGAVADFRESRKLVTEMRADMVPADQDRVALEKGLSLVYEGLVDAGNRLARQTGDRKILKETFDAAEQDRLWSLRALIPSPNDWRTKLPEHYWELLVKYQNLERTAISKTTPELERATAALRQELQQIEAAAAGNKAGENTQSALDHVQRILDNDTVLLSFHVSKTSSWIWAADRGRVDVYPLPPLQQIQTEVQAFGKALRAGTPATETGAKLYRDLFGTVPVTYLRHKRWLLELDGPLHELPFAALVTGEDTRGPIYLVESADLQSLPNALLAERGSIPANGEFLGVSDAVYNPADPRYRGKRVVPDLLLARLLSTATGVQACARAWNSPHSRILSGEEAQMGSVLSAIESNPAIIHFSTHVVTAPGDFRTGLIALSLNQSGEMGLLGPKEIVARPVTARLVVMDGCHSAQGDSLPSAGLMGLTRAWIGAGAMAVLATQWDMPDDSANSLMADFYRALRTAPGQGAAHALREAQLAALRNPAARQAPATWAGYFLLSRMF